MLTEVVDVEAEWPFIAATIAPAVVGPPSLEDVFEGLKTHHRQAWRVKGGAAGYVITTTMLLPSGGGLWVTYVGGKVFRSTRRVMGQIGAELQAIASGWGCTEMRVVGARASQWLRVLDGFEAMDDETIRKVLQ